MTRSSISIVHGHTRNYLKTLLLKATDIYYLTVSMGRESRDGLARSMAGVPNNTQQPGRHLSPGSAEGRSAFSLPHRLFAGHGSLLAIGGISFLA